MSIVSYADHNHSGFREIIANMLFPHLTEKHLHGNEIFQLVEAPPWEMH